MVANPIKMPISTTGQGSPISIPLSGGTAVATSNPVVTTNFGTFQIGGMGNSAASGLPTPNSIFGGGAIAELASSPVLMIVGLAVAAYFFMRK